VRPWPTGPTSAANLLTLCRRHHRIKQRPGWVVRLSPDGAATWTDPAGRHRTTAPLDALETVLLRSDPVEAGDAAAPNPRPQAVTRSRADSTDDAWSGLESCLAIRLEHLRHSTGHRPSHRRCASAGDLRKGLARPRARAPVPDEPPF